MKSLMTRALAHTLRWLVRHGRKPWALPLLAVVALADSLVPMVPAELLAVSLFILQPQRVRFIALVFTLAAAGSTWLLAATLSGVMGWAGGSFDPQALAAGPGWDQARALVNDWGPAALALAGIFPDSPRTSVAVAALAGMPPLTIAAAILAGKALLYAALVMVVEHGPRWAGRLPGRRLPRMHRRLMALRRLLATPRGAPR